MKLILANISKYWNCIIIILISLCIDEAVSWCLGGELLLIKIFIFILSAAAINHFLDKEKVIQGDILLFSLIFCCFAICALKCKKIIPILGVFFLIYLILLYWLEFWQKLSLHMKSCHSREPSKKVFWLSAILIWIPSLLTWLYLFPGTLCVDQPAQLKQAVSLSFSNANPFVNTLVITACVQLCYFLGGSTNSGVALYTLLQFTGYSLIGAYTVQVIYKKGFHNLFIFLTVCFYAVMPYNPVYATGMWKDTFFAMFFLWTIVYIYDHLGREVTKKQFFGMFFLTFISALARNSGWSSLGIWAIVLFSYHGKTIRKIGVIVAGGSIMAVIMTVVVYPAVGIGDIKSVNALSVPVQQIARVLVDGNTLTDEESALLTKVADLEDIVANYSPRIYDPLKRTVSGEVIKEEKTSLFFLWIKLGFRYPRSYAKAFIDLTKGYFWPEAHSWIWDVRIFDNDYGIEKQSLISLNMMGIWSRLHKLPWMTKIVSSGCTLWVILLGILTAKREHDRLGIAFYIPFLAIYIGLFLTSYDALFRYTYGANIALPLFLIFPLTRDIGLNQDLKSES